MVVFSKEVRKFFNAVDIPEIKTEGEKRRYTRMRVASSSNLKAGMFMAFKYDGAVVVAFIAKTKLNPGGTYRSNGTKNLLMTAFKLNSGSDIVLQAFVEGLNNSKEKTSTYNKNHLLKTVGVSIIRNLSRFRLTKSFKLAKTLLTVLGKNNFRTYKVSKMRWILELEIMK